MVIGGDPGAVVKAAWTVAGLKPALTFVFQRNETFLPRSLTKNFESSVWRYISVISFFSPSSRVYLAQFSLYMHKGGLNTHALIHSRWRCMTVDLYTFTMPQSTIAGHQLQFLGCREVGRTVSCLFIILVRLSLSAGFSYRIGSSTPHLGESREFKLMTAR